MMLMTDDADVEARRPSAPRRRRLLTGAGGLVSTTAVVANEELAKVDCERQYHKPICKTGGFKPLGPGHGQGRIKFNVAST
ncbi:FMN binding protein [Aureococcus anophagefferens]|nr:FMN binding protein [Aureococcus anophagefferens]